MKNRNALARIGALRDSISHETHGLEPVVGSDSDVMVYQEMGTQSIAPRPVLRLAAARKGRDVVKIAGDGVVAKLISGWSGESAMRVRRVLSPE